MLLYIHDPLRSWLRLADWYNLTLELQFQRGSIP